MSEAVHSVFAVYCLCGALGGITWKDAQLTMAFYHLAIYDGNNTSVGSGAFSTLYSVDIVSMFVNFYVFAA